MERAKRTMRTAMMITTGYGLVVSVLLQFFPQITERGKGYGALIFQKAIDTAKQYLGDCDLIQIEAQLTKQHFHEKFGFVATSEPFMLEGLLYLEMELRL